MTVKEVLAALYSVLPPGAQDLYDFAEGDVGQIFEALAEAWKAYGYDPADELAANVNPATCDPDTLATWEVVLGLSLTRIATYGSVSLRRSAVLSKLREAGPTSIPNVKAIVGPLLGYVDPTQLVVVETDRAALRTAHTYSWPAGAVPAAPAAGYQQTVMVPDTEFVSAAGAHVRLNLSAPDAYLCTVTLASPPPSSLVVVLANYGDLGTGAVVSKQYSWFVPEVAGVEVGGNWTLAVGNAGPGAGTVNVGATARTDIFVEGIGRVGFTPHEGLGAAAFGWGIVVDPTLEGQAHESDRAAALATLDRIKQAHTEAYMLVDSSFGTPCAIPDVSTPSASIPCT